MKWKVHIRKEYRAGARVLVLESYYVPEVGQMGELILRQPNPAYDPERKWEEVPYFIHVFAPGTWARVEPVFPAGTLDSGAKSATISPNAAEAAHTEAT